MKINIVKMSLVTAMLLTTGAHAGKIIGANATDVYNDTTPPTQFGFGGWNLDNVDVRIVDAETGVETGGIFNELNGTYEPITYGESFVSDILGGDDNLTIMGELRGKDYPVGEPAGIKIINDDPGTAKSGKSPNCIMTTSYLSADKTDNNVSGLLDSGDPLPTVCSSPFQSHKRFKINMQVASVDGADTVTAPNTVTGGLGQPIDLVFNLDGDDDNDTVRRYQVFQKINNYTGMRLDGYKIQLLDENGSEVNASNLIKFSLDLTTKEGSDENGYEAVFSNGLWGPKDDPVRVPPHFETDGFFDSTRAGFTQEGNNSTTVTGGPDTLNSNYVDLFGIWLPSKWAPYGIFFDDDNDANTDAELVAFWGTVPNAVPGTAPAWHKGNDYNVSDDIEPWELVTADELEEWKANPLYSIGKIEDTLNLGLNYVVEVGLNSTIGETFTIRITPRVAEDQTPPSYIDGNGDYILPPELITPPSSGGGGGGCTYNPNSKNFDMTFLMLMAMGLLYPFRRRFLK